MTSRCSFDTPAAATLFSTKRQGSANRATRLNRERGMSAQPDLVGLIEVDVPEGRSLASVLESLVSTTSEDRTVLCRVRRESNPKRSTIQANVPQLTESLESAYDAACERLANH